MIGHYLLTLTPEQEDRLLTRPFRGLLYGVQEGCSVCLVWTALGLPCISWKGEDMGSAKPYRGLTNGPAYVFEDLTRRFGDERIQIAIRNRILSNRARRVFQKPSELMAVVAAV